MSALGHPNLSDPLYKQFAGKGAKLARQGMCLWAQHLEFDHPLTGQLPKPSRDRGASTVLKITAAGGAVTCQVCRAAAGSLTVRLQATGCCGTQSSGELCLLQDGHCHV
jgi:hypothetical protein